MTSTGGGGIGATTQYRYDGMGHLMHVTTEAGLRIDYVHDALGRRIGKVVGSGAPGASELERGWLYKDGLNPIAELGDNGALRAVFVYGTRAHVPDFLVRPDGTTYRYITDHLGSVRMLVNVTDGTVAQQLDYDVFGRVVLDTAPGFQPFAYAGGLYDAETELVRFGARDYDAYTGRWNAKDPILFGGGDSNLYAYVAGDAVNRVDPSGLWTFGVGVSGSVGAGAGVTGSVVVGFDSSGNVGVISSAGAGSVVGVSASAGLTVQGTDAASLSDLAGSSIAAGVSYGTAVIPGVEGVVGAGYEGMNGNLGLGLNLGLDLPQVVVLTGFVEYTDVRIFSWTGFVKWLRGGPC